MSSDHVADWIELEGAHTVRVVGGLPAGDRRTKAGVLLRSDGLDALTESDVSHLVTERGLLHVVDLRSASERRERGRGRLGEAPTVRYYDVEVITEADLERRRLARAAQFESGADPIEIMASGYEELLQLGAAAFAAVIERLVEPDGTPALVHCSAGKDRTGVLVALLLAAAGVDRAAIVADYAATQERMERVFGRLRSAEQFEAMKAQLPTFALEAQPETMARFLDHVDAVWGGAAAWFEAQGVSAEVLARWRDKLVG
jgi:protein tyrosine/serine phosphatase